MRVAAAIIALLFFLPCAGLAISPSQMSELRVQVDQDVQLSFEGTVDEAEIRLMAPQQDAFQTVVSMEASVPYEPVADQYGNRMIKVSLKNPGKTERFTVRSIVTVKRKTSASVPDNPAFSNPTPLIQSDDPEITGLAGRITAGESGSFARAAAITGWVNENIRYDLAYGDVNLSAKETLKNRAGVCDEFSALTLAMLRGMGYRASYAVGYSYGQGYTVADNFVAHGWVEACDGNYCLQIDPTWGEAGWLDASHVKFASIPDTYYVEAVATASGRSLGAPIVIKSNIEKSFTILSSKEEPLIKTDARLLDQEVWNDHAVLRTDLSTDGCVLTKITYGSCTRGGAPLLEPEENQTTIHFCSRGSAFMPFAIPGDLDKNLIYTCSLGTVPTGGEQKSAELTLNPTQAVTQRPGLALDRTTARPGETVTASAQGAQVFTRKGDYGLDGLVLTAHADDFRVYAYRNGMLDRSDVTVTEFTPVRLAVSTDAEEVKAGETVNVTVLVTNTDTRERNVNVRVGGETKSAAVGAGASKSPAFRFATDESTAVVQAFAESEGFSTSAAIPIKVERPQNILDQIIRMITEFLAMLLGG